MAQKEKGIEIHEEEEKKYGESKDEQKKDNEKSLTESDESDNENLTIE
jgi:hypothetical protein